MSKLKITSEPNCSTHATPLFRPPCSTILAAMSLTQNQIIFLLHSQLERYANLFNNPIPPAFVTGKAVLIAGLVNHPQYNGCSGTMVSAAGSDRIRVRLASTPPSTIKVRLANLRHDLSPITRSIADLISTPCDLNVIAFPNYKERRVVADISLAPGCPPSHFTVLTHALEINSSDIAFLFGRRGCDGSGLSPLTFNIAVSHQGTDYGNIMDYLFATKGLSNALDGVLRARGLVKTLESVTAYDIYHYQWDPPNGSPSSAQPIQYFLAVKQQHRPVFVAMQSACLFLERSLSHPANVTPASNSKRIVPETLEDISSEIIEWSKAHLTSA